MNKLREKIKERKILSFKRALVLGFCLVILFAAANLWASSFINALPKIISPAKAQTTSLYLVNINVTAITSTTATITWETNLPANSSLKYGLTDAYELTSTCGSCQATDLVTTHRLTVGNLNAATTYHFQVISATASETKTSQDRNFATASPSGGSDTTAPFVTYIKVDSTNTQAIVNINTNEETHVTVYYSLTPGVTQATPTYVAEDPDQPYRISHAPAFTVTGGTRYYYRIYSVDRNGNSSLTAEFDFTSSTSTDHVFSTGLCPGNVPLGACTADGNYCDVGTGTLVKNCEQCGASCAAGQTCRPGGECTNDPSLSGDPYQCNSSACYDAANQFTPSATVNCYASYPRCDANTILKVKRDRECAKWFTCGTAIDQNNPTTGQSEELCLNSAVCTSLGENGQCNSYVELPKAEMTYRTPAEISKIKYLTGSLNAGLDWQYQSGAPVIRGYYPWSAMEEVGGKISIENYNFENTTSPRAVDNDPASSSVLTYDIRLWPAWQTYADPVSETNPAISSEWDPETANKKDNHVLAVQQISALNQGAVVKLGAATSTGFQYVLSLKIKSSAPQEQKVTFALANNTNPGGSSPDVSSFGEYALTTGWQTILTRATAGVGGSVNYLRIYVSGGSLQTFYIDEVKIQPVLEAGSGVYLSRSCRLYPKEDSPACEYTDDNGITNKGWYGYCLERDPKNESLCLSWWPVDILFGESNLFGSEQTAGYTGRKPLYYCLESRGRGNYQPWGFQPDFNEAVSNWNIFNSRGWVRTATWDKIPSDLLDVYLYDIASIRLQTDPDNDHYHPRGSNGNPPYLGWTNNNQVDGWQADDLQFSNNYFWTMSNTTVSEDGHHGDWIRLQVDNKNMGDFDAALRIAFYFNRTTLKLELFGYVWAYNKNNVTHYSPPYLRIYMYFKDRCDKIVQVVDEFGNNAAWAETINSSVTPVLNLNYGKTSDLDPYGGAVTSSSDPTSWSLPLFAQDANDYTIGLGTPFQLRSGRPYACFGPCSQKVCSGGGKDGQSCHNNTDCLGANNTGQGLCVGVGSCFSTAQACTNDSQCPGDICIGGAASSRGAQLVNDAPAVADSYFAMLRLRGLFAKTYGFWRWDTATGHYAGVYSTPPAEIENPIFYSWNPPTDKCSGTTRQYSPTDLNSYCGYAPQIRNIKLGDGSSNTVKLGLDGGKIKLSFNTVVDSQQQPLKTFYIDWGDGNVDAIPFGYKSKDSPDSPHVYNHAYGSCRSASCTYVIKILAEDSWGWCSARPEGRTGSCEDISLEGNKARWDPVDSNACSGGTCIDGICTDGVDGGRSCGALTVELKD
ncbi:MAG: fibronectin type III domain-containing protein [Patescibacteria group bacterium]